MTRKDIGVGLLGLGVVGSGVVEVLRNKENRFAEQIGTSLVLKRVLVQNINRQRRVKLDRHLLTGQVKDIVNDPAVDIVIELIGGEHPATEYIRQAIAAGKHVVTANKEVIAKHGPELLSLAREHGVELRYEASVGSGIPLISPFQQDLAANDISAVYGILNGTTNYILTRMAQDGLDFAAALKQAQKLGYAETNPANDIEGTDTAYKLAILSNLAFHARFDPRDIYCEGISRLQAQDFRYAQEFGYSIKLLAIAKLDGNTVEMRVHPVFIPQDSQLAKVEGVYNAIQIESDLAGRIIFYGEGAGAFRATSAILSDTLVIAKNVSLGIGNVREVLLNQKLDIKPMGDLETRYYFRLNVSDRPGVLAQISRVLGDNSISISSVIQKESDRIAQTAVLVVMTHPAQERCVQAALKQLEQLTVVNEVSNFIRVEG